MPSSRGSAWFQDIVDACTRIEAWIERVGGVHGIMADDAMRSAVERQLLIVSEAAIRLRNVDGDITQKLAPQINWAGVRGIGNVIRHRYDDMDFDLVVEVLNNELRSLREACEHALKAING